jgi:HNH endonuclease
VGRLYEVLGESSKAPLQRCHIIPKSLGGSDDPNNLFLMCRECHDLSPDTTDVDLFFQWARNQSYIKRKMDEIKRAFLDFGIDLSDLQLFSRYMAVLQSDDFIRWHDTNVGIHGYQNPPYGSRIAPSSIAAGLISYCKNHSKSLEH